MCQIHFESNKNKNKRKNLDFGFFAGPNLLIMYHFFVYRYLRKPVYPVVLFTVLLMEHITLNYDEDN